MKKFKQLGASMEFCERTKDALKRELMEEVGILFFFFV